MQFLGMNTRRESLSDPALRRALSAGIDRETLVSSCLLGQGTAAQLPASPAYAGYDTALETPYDTAAYNRLLNAALGEQAEDETPLTLTLLVNEESSFKVSAAQEIAMYLNTARLTVTVEAVPWDTFLTRLESGDFDLYYGECRLTADWDLTALLSTEGSLNYGGWSDETTDRLLQAYRSNGADANLVALWQQLLDTAPFAPICFKSVSVVTTEGVVQGLSPTETAPLSPLTQKLTNMVLRHCSLLRRLRVLFRPPSHARLVRPAGRIKGAYAMSQVTKRALEASLKKLLLEKPLHKITVSDITDDCGINRMTFYYHFKDIYDLVEWSCQEDASRALAGKKTYETWQQGLLQIFEAVQENKPFILNVYRSVSREQVENYLYKLTYDLLEGVVEEQARGMSVRPEDKAFIATLYKYMFVGLMLDWIRSDMKGDPHLIVERLDQVIHGSVDAALARLRTDKPLSNEAK
jgi:probable dihydroxyacetone kinase regulator